VGAFSEKCEMLEFIQKWVFFFFEQAPITDVDLGHPWVLRTLVAVANEVLPAAAEAAINLAKSAL
jgi:hypothetical protein